MYIGLFSMNVISVPIFILFLFFWRMICLYLTVYINYYKMYLDARKNKLNNDFIIWVK